MELVEAAAFAVFKMVEHGLMDKGWKFQFDTAVRTFGYCHHGRKTVSLSKPLTELNDEQEVKDTILHEIAHALCPRGAGHGDLWKQKCREIGAKPERCFSRRTVVVPEVTKYKYECPGCKRQITKTYIMKKPRACGACCNEFSGGRFNVVYAFRLVETIRPIKDVVETKRSYQIGDRYHG